MVPLSSGLIGSSVLSIHGQLEVSLVGYDVVRVVIRRRLYCGLPDVEFSVADTDLPDIIAILSEAKEKLDAHWLSKVAATG